MVNCSVNQITPSEYTIYREHIKTIVAKVKCMLIVIVAKFIDITLLVVILVDDTIDDMLAVLPKSLLIQSDAIALKDVIGRGTFGH